MWWWRKVRPAGISDDLRKQLERYGETIIAHALATAPMGLYGGPLYGLLQREHQAALDWLTERRDIHQRREDRLEMVEWAILIFVVVGVIVESGLARLVLAVQHVDDLEKKIADLERENADLRAQIPHRNKDASIGEDTTRVLVQIFKAEQIVDRDVGNMARALNMDPGVLQYHLDRLEETGLADVTGGNYIDGHIYWGLTPKGRRHVVEHKLIDPDKKAR